MNIYFQIAGLVLLFVIYIMYWQYGKIKLGNQRIFQNLLFNVTICLILDAVSVICINLYQGEESYLLDLVCKLYLISLVSLVFFSYKYIIYEIIQSDEVLVKCSTVISVMKYLFSFLILIVPIYYVWENEVYTYGPCTILTYIFCFIVMMINYYNLFRYRKNIERRRWTASLMWMLCWFTAALIQFINSQLLLVGFAGAIGIIILYIKLENPESYRDRETSLFNAHSLSVYMSELVSNDVDFSLFVISLDMEEKVYTHSLEMRLIREVINKINKIDNTMLFRTQEKEFILLIKDIEKIPAIEKSVVDYFNEDILVDGNKYHLSASYYRIFNSKIASTIQLELIRAFVNEKRETAKNKIVVMDDKWIKFRQQKYETEQMIFKAMNEDRVEVYYQPIFSVEDNSFCSAEALVRIIDEEGKIVPPGVFIPIAEMNQSIIQLGEIVFDKVCRMIVDNKIEDKGFKYIEVNVSAIQSTKNDFADKYIEIMKRTGVNPKMINLEITETAAVRSKEILLENMNKLLEFGVSFSLDDFGTGYSNLNYIMELPVQIVKFDKIMTDSYFESEKAKIVMCSAINMIQTIGMEIVAEGVEKEEQLDELRKEKVDFIQGYYFSRPVPENTFIAKYCA